MTRKHRSTLLIAIAFTLASAPALAIKPFSADYQASYKGLSANGHMSLAPAGGDRWTYSLTINGAGAELKQSTVFEDKDGVWRPLSGSDSTRGVSGLGALLVKAKSSRADYDWNKGVATWSGDVKDDRAGPIPLQPGDVDALLLNLTLARDLAAGKSLRYRMVDDGRAKTLACQATGSDPLTIGGQQKPANKAVCDDGNKQIIVWVVDGLAAPARILQRKNGKDDIDLRLDKAA